MISLSKEDVLLIHKEVIQRYGGTHGVRDDSLLESAMSAPFQGFGDYEFFPTIADKVIRLCFGLVKNHPFHDGNKRIGAAALLVMLDQNELKLSATCAELTAVILDLASGNIGDEELSQWVKNRIMHA